ncbi:periplasmic solute-binding protein [Candidatus Scalindua japonica]|uniref:Chorismate dehydratase n=1 Tax=Candidatus Scalindua japonica TaxID=1284222 RepID=A0A286TX98_9BACT|nr:menaquinone biosynthesis protein [Candidatus Scalindua japonica]GAX60500.1 periplasmic solute-binding protein [Candidatus Scalindua japonica]
MDKLKIGVVPYMNAKPFIYGFLKKADQIDIVYGVPSVLPEMLVNDELDLISMPSVGYFRSTGYEIIPGSAIASNGLVESVKLFIKVPSIEKIRTVALDRDSMTSCVLTKVILGKKYSLKPEYIVLEDKQKIYNEYADAFLVIGDDAMNVREEGFIVLDLGQEWKELTGLPFVYAVWVAKSGSGLQGLSKLIIDAKECGIKSLDEIADVEAARLGMKKERCLWYLKESIKYNLDEQEIRGLKSFYNYALEMGEVKDGVKIEFYNQ